MMTRPRHILLCLLALAPAATAFGQPAHDAPATPLRALSGSIEALTRKVSPAVVQVLTTGFTTVDDGDGDRTDLVVGRQRSMGSGVIVDPSGLIVTNAHVIRGARRVQVILKSDDRKGRPVDAAIVGTAQELDLALLRIAGTNLPHLPFADYRKVQQGQLVFAFGSPQGLRDSMTMGVVSTRERQMNPDDPIFYLQTDAPVNKGNSGGPLVNVDGELIGINTFIMSDSGGSQGLGFALPSSLVEMGVAKLRQFGRLHRGRIGVILQTVTPALADGLGLDCASGALVADVLPGSPADAVGIRIGDVIDQVDGETIDSVLPVAQRLFTSSGDEQVRLRVHRGAEARTVSVPIIAAANDFDRLSDMVDPEKGAIARLGIIGVTVTAEIAQQMPAIRVSSGVAVAARSPLAPVDVPLMTGDVIHGVNGRAIATIEQLRAALAEVPGGHPLVLQVERNGQLNFVTADADW
jgi:serine protease Do